MLGGALLHDVEDLRRRVVVADDLLGEQLEHERREVERVGNEPEAPVGSLVPEISAAGSSSLNCASRNSRTSSFDRALDLRVAS